MSKMSKEIDKIAEKLCVLVQAFRNNGPAKDFEWWNENSPKSMFYPRYGYEEMQLLYESVVQDILRMNPEMLSEFEVDRRLRFDFLVPQTIKVAEAEHLNSKGLFYKAKEHLNGLVKFQAWQNVDIAIANLWHRGELVHLGEVIFMNITKDETDLWKERGHVSDRISDVHVVARVKAPGDRQKALSYSIACVNQTLDIMRAFCFPFGRHSGTWLVGLLGDIIDSKHTPIRIDNRDFVTLIGSGIAQIELEKHILSKLGKSQWELIVKLILKKESSRSNMENKLLVGTHWLSESTKLDTNNSKFAKIAFALETLLGGEPKDEDLKVRGITAMLAERSSFISGKDLNDRQAIDRDIRKYYRMRSEVVHGGEREVSLDDIENFGQLVRRISIDLLEKLNEMGDELTDIEKLEKWVKLQRYTLPER